MDNIKLSASFKLAGNTLSTYCTQTINMTSEAYQYMMSTPVAKMSINHWKRMSENQRISEHLKEVQNMLRADSFNFVVFND